MIKILLTIYFLAANQPGYIILTGFKDQADCEMFAKTHTEFLPGLIVGSFRYPPDIDMVVTKTVCEPEGNDL